MKRKIKRKLFLMGMALAAGVPGIVWAKGNSKPGHLGEQYYGSARQVLQSSASDAEGVSIDALYSRLNRLTGAMSYSQAMVEAPPKPLMKLEMLPPSEPVQDGLNPMREKRVGVALRIAF